MNVPAWTASQVVISGGRASLAFGMSATSDGFTGISPARTASFNALCRMVPMYRTVRADRPPVPSARPADSSSRYNAVSLGPVNATSLTPPMWGTR